MRLFLAVNCGEQLQQELATRLDPVRRQLSGCPALRWARPDSWHLTLQFLGEWPESRLPGLERALDRLAGSGEFLLQPRGLGAFPGFRRPRVLFLHLESGGKAERLAAGIRDVVAEVWPDGPQDGKPFRAHLTLARVKGRLTAEQLAVLADLDLTGLPVEKVTDFRLVASVLHPAGARHRDLAVMPLAGKSP